MASQHETKGVSSIPDPDPEELGPAMLACTPGERRFAIAAVMFPLAKDWQIAKAAGFSDRSHGYLRKAACILFHSERVLAAIRECADKEVRSSGMLAVATIKKIVRSDGHRDQFKAAAMLAGLNGMTVAQNINVNQTVTERSSPAMLQKIAELCRVLGVDPQKLIGVNSEPVVDGEFTEV